jgi:LmbE family N-acetylglucosaminyl deacetylase
MASILAVGAHPDDIELGCGATLAWHLDRGDKVHYLIMTNGEGGAASPATRREEGLLAAAELPVESVRFGEVSAFDLSTVQQKYVEIIEEVIHGTRPKRVYTHSRFDRHQNHEVTARCTEIAARNVSEVLTFELPSTRYGDFRPSYFVDVADTIGRKLELLQVFGSQSEKPYMAQGVVIARAQDWAVGASFAGAVVAEAFCVERMIV